MKGLPRHQCLIYDGSPAKVLPTLAAQFREKLDGKYRCLYLNSPAMVAGMRSYLYAAGIDVEEVVASGRLILSSEQLPLKDGKFDADRMLTMLEDALLLALEEGCQGLFATGDMSWEMGSARDLDILLEYEWRLEKLFEKYPALSGICQYHAQTLPRDMVCHGVLVHPALYVNNTLARVNPQFIPSDSPIQPVTPSKDLIHTVKNLCCLHPERAENS